MNYHPGSLPGALAGVNPISDAASSATLSFRTNSLGLSDTPEWVGPLVLEALLQLPERSDDVAAAEPGAAENAKWWPATIAECCES